MRAQVWMVAVFLLGCSSSGPRSITGQLSSGYSVDNPVVIAQAVGGRTFVTHVLPNGSFHLTVAAPGTYRVTLANSTRTGAYRGIARLPWSVNGSKLRWARLGTGGPVVFGSVRPATTSGLSTASEPAVGDSADSDGKIEDDEHDDALECDGSDEVDSADDSQGDQIDGASDDSNEQEVEVEMADQCAGTGVSSAPASTTAAGTSQMASPCAVNADCAAGLTCLASTCSSLLF